MAWIARVAVSRIAVAALVAALFGPDVMGASFPCERAKTPQEKAICATPALSAADEQMAAAYKAAMGRKSSDAASLKASQQAWLRETALRCHARTVGQEQLAACMLERYKDRIATLEDGRQHLQGIAFSTATKTLHFQNTKDDSPSFEGKTVGTLNASWPVADSRAPEWVAWNAAVEQAARDLADDRLPSTGKHSPVWKPEWAEAVDADLNAGDVEMVSLGPALGTLVSVLLGNEFMGFGAAHPGEAWRQFHWLLDKRRPLQAADLFAPEGKWKAVFTHECMASLRSQPNVGYGEEDELQAVKEEAPKPENWSLDTEGITVVFPEYTVSPRVAPVEPVLVRWKLLEPYFAPGFITPR